MSDFQRHPLSAVFPDMPGAELDLLAEDIRANGQREPGITLDGMILDGWHRYLACIRAGAEFEAVPFRGKDPAAFVLSKNLHRRHMTGSQRAQAIVAVSEWRPHGVTSRAAPGAALTDKQMADAAEVSVRTIRQAKVVEDQASEAVKGSVRDGTLSVKKAEQIARQPPEQQAEALRKAQEAPPSKPRASASPEELETLRERLRDAEEARDELAQIASDLQARLDALEIKEPDAQQAEIIRLRKQIDKLEFEIKRLTRERNAVNATCNELKREVKKLRRNAG